MWNAASLKMRSPKAIANRVVVEDVLVEVFVGSKDAQGKAASFQDEVDQLPLDLVETLPDIGAGSGDILPPELGKLEVQGSKIPCVLGACGGSGACIQSRVFP